ncbi:helix-turn-helix domain-containing protein [Niabella drilacis]|uniref:Helix-turn-helix domain-containing protein n=1 Tax=Niabella drilacis (strain DSM 25811 / CCM 8410 / CCUG 62505 / LMG 26954 / E90) TaxID=1285928 RepID=A0A1G6XI59_NIADE|nr:helix-turn-helix domain-containing protein [Niabella drilacis]SDD76896.1 Helix-turn-helix domain-containing protein [Niabella drilacis]
MTPTLSFDALPSILADINQKINFILSKEPVDTSQQESPINIQRAAEILGLAKQTIYQKTEIPRYKKGGKLFFFESELLAWVRSSRAKNSFEIQTVVDSAIASHKK